MVNFYQQTKLSAMVGAFLLLANCDQLLEPPGPSPTSSETPQPVETAVAPPLDEEEAAIVANPTPIDLETGATPSEPVVEVSPTPEETPSPEPSIEPTPEPISTPTPVEEPLPTPSPEPTAEPAFYYYPPGDLEPNSGQGYQDNTIYIPDLVFPIKDAPAFLQSQVYRFGGGMIGGDQCDPRNFSYPWRDNYCEKRSRDNGTPYCPINKVHLGQDIRVGTPEGCNAERRQSASDRRRYAVVASEDGLISNIGRYTVNVRAGGRIYRYMHMNMMALEVSLGQSVKAGDTLGYVSNDFGGTPTTLHLHFEIKHNTAESGWTWAPPYTSLVAAYERREGSRGAMIVEDDADIVGVASE